MPAKGSCLCGNIKISFDAEPLMLSTCSCNQCRKVTGAATALNCIIPKDSFKVEGTPKVYDSPHGESGKTIHVNFCPDCGSSMWAEPDAFPGVVVVKTGILDQEEGGKDPLEVFKPTVEGFTSRRVSWLAPVEGCAQFEKAISS